MFGATALNFQIFPPSSLDNSILTSVLVGLLIVWVMQETLGWGISGLIIPGYLGSVFVIQPVTGGVIVLEAVLTWFVVQALSEQVPHRWPWTRLFGRDRFFNILLVSVLVRVVLEWGGFWRLQEALGLDLNWDLYSMGLVLVPLLANALWRSGILLGLPRVGVPVLLTWAVLRFVLLRYTNLSLSNFELTYEDLAVDFVDSPRAYILLLTGAWMASSANLRWGWDFGGLIVPGLLTLCWLEPSKLLATLVEGLLMAGIFRAVIRLPGVRRLDLTGVRSLVAAFALGYAIKYALAWVLPSVWPGLRPTDLFGFGYLLPTLIALRIVSYRDAAHVLIPCVVTSLAGFLVATGLGYGLAVLLPTERNNGPVDVPSARDEALATVEQALQESGETPPIPESLLRSSTPLVQAGGDGFGALKVSPKGAPLVIVGRAGAVAMPQVVLALADSLHARGAWLCAPAGDACDPLRSALRDDFTVIEVIPGEQTQLVAAEGLKDAPLRALLPELAVRTGNSPVSRLTLTVEDRLALAAGWIGADPDPAEDIVGASWTEDPLQIAWRENPEERLVSSSDLNALDELVFRPWVLWREGGPGAEDALRAAAGAAARFGLRMGRTEGLSTLVGPSWRVSIQQGGAPLLVSAPDVLQEPDTGSLAAELLAQLGGAALVLDAPSPHPIGKRSTESPAHIASLTLLRSFGVASRAITVRGTRDVLDPGSEIVLSTGRPMPMGMRRDAFFRQVEDLVRLREWSYSWYDGDPQRLSFQDPMNPLRSAAAAAGGEHITVWASSPLRRDVAEDRAAGGR